MIVSLIDPEAKATRAASAGSRALTLGDTLLAQQKYAEAAEILKAGAARTRALPEKNHLRFLAASQYYHGGDYQKAKSLVAKIRPGKLSQKDRMLFEQFCEDVEIRSKADYAQKIRTVLFEHRQNQRYEEAICLLQDHPYVVDRAGLAFMRADLCLDCGKIEAAAMFSADANKFSNFRARTVILRAGGAYLLSRCGKENEACNYLRLIVQNEPTSVDLAEAAIAMYKKFDLGDKLLGPQIISLIDRAMSGHLALPEDTRKDHCVSDSLSHGTLLAAKVSDALHGRKLGLRYFDAAESYAASEEMIALFKHLRTTDLENSTWSFSDIPNVMPVNHIRREDIAQTATFGHLTAA